MMNRYQRAANGLCSGQIYPFENPLLREPLKVEQIKPRPLGHWGSSPGQNFIYIHLNRLIKKHVSNIIYISGPGNGGTLPECLLLFGRQVQRGPS
jgi:xylulose-5-phosphate/fructose-6-phosphate phosphoketolase